MGCLENEKGTADGKGITDGKGIVDGKCIIVGAGEFVPIEIPKDEGDFCIAADGGLENCEMVGLFPDMIIGDFDSAGPMTRRTIEEMEIECPERVKRLPPEKDDTDILYGIRLGLEKGYRKFYLYGALGGRLDHTIGNIQCLIYLRNRGAKGYIMEHNQLLTIAQNETITFHKSMKGRLSVFSMTEKSEGVTLSDLKYELKDAVITNDFPIGISNEFVGKAASVTVEKGTLLVMVAWE